MAALTPVASVEALVSAIQKSGLLAADKLGKVREAATATTDPKQFARELVKDGTLTKWQAGQLLHGYHLLIVGKYKLLDQIGTAPTGRLYLAEHAQIGRRHTLKVLAKRLASKPQAVKQFLSAAQNACGLDHHNISHVYDVNQDGDRHYVVMDYVEGEDLEHLIERQGPVNLPQALDFIAQAAEGLAHAHDNGVVHGDLKPSNLLREYSGIIKILEIGQTGTGAAFEAEGADESVEMAALGAVIFQAPELRGDGEVADVACDVYSLGSVFCFLLTGKAAPDAASAVKQLQAVGGIPESVIDLCGRMMADKPADRPRTISAVLEQLVAAAQPPTEPQPQNANREVGPDEQGRQQPKKLAEAAPKSKKPPVAKAIAEGGLPPIVIPDGTQPIKEPEPLEPFSIKTRGRGGKQPGGKNAKTANASPTEAAAEGIVSADESPAEAVPKTFTPLVLAGAIGGGGALVLGLIIAVVCVFAFGGGKKPVAQSATAKADVAAGKSVAAAAEPESNPELSSEKNPEVNPIASLAQNDPPAGATAAEGAANSKPAESSAPVAGSSAGKSASAEPPATPSASSPEAKTEPLSEKKSEPEPKPESKPEPKTEPPAKPAAKPATPKPAPKPPAKPEPFKGFTAAVSLPELPEAMGQPSTDATAPLVLGPFKIDDAATLIVTLLGADGAIRASRQKFELQPRPGSTRDWDFFLTGGAAPAVIATLSAKEGNLLFQWTDEGLKQAPLAKQLCNCALDLTSGASHHVAALRTAMNGDPLVVEIDKPSVSAKWNIGDLPVAKQLFLQVTRTEGIKAYRQEPKGPVNVGETLTIATGATDKSTPLHLKLSTSANARAVDIKLMPQVKLEGQEQRAYRRKDLLGLQPQVSQEIKLLETQIKQEKARRPTQEIEKLARDQKVAALTSEILVRANVEEQLRFLTSFADNFPGTALIHFRVYYQAGDHQIDLLRTEEAPPPAKAK
jgi:serine/threonine protein kinase